VYLHVVLWAGGSYLTTLAFVRLFKVRSEHVLPVLAGLAAGLYYWFVAPQTASTLGLPDGGTWGLRAAALTLVGLWLWRALRRAWRHPVSPAPGGRAVPAGPLPNDPHV
jgi:hypothetical protein